MRFLKTLRGIVRLGDIEYKAWKVICDYFENEYEDLNIDQVANKMYFYFDINDLSHVQFYDRDKLSSALQRLKNKGMIYYNYGQKFWVVLYPFTINVNAELQQRKKQTEIPINVSNNGKNIFSKSS